MPYSAVNASRDESLTNALRLSPRLTIFRIKEQIIICTSVRDLYGCRGARAQVRAHFVIDAAVSWCDDATSNQWQSSVLGSFSISKNKKKTQNIDFWPKTWTRDSMRFDWSKCVLASVARTWICVWYNVSRPRTVTRLPRVKERGSAPIYAESPDQTTTEAQPLPSSTDEDDICYYSSMKPIQASTKT